MHDSGPSLFQRLKRLQQAAIGIALYSPIALARWLPYRWRVPAVGWLTSRVIAPLAGYDRRVRENLALVAPQIPPAEAARIARGVTDNAGRNMIELFSAAEFVARVRDTPIEGPGLPAIRAARREGRPIIFVTGHLGSFNAARVAMIAQGVEMGVFYRPMSNAWFNARYRAAMGAISQPMFEQGRRGTVEMLRHLGKGGVVAILADINTHDGVPLEFFGKPALTPLTPGELALRFDALLVPGWGIRAPNGLDFLLHAEEPIAHSDPVSMAREFNARLEARIREHMAQWFWVHRRWKDGANALGKRRAKELEKLERKLSDQR